MKYINLYESWTRNQFRVHVDANKELKELLKEFIKLMDWPDHLKPDVEKLESVYDIDFMEEYNELFMRIEPSIGGEESIILNSEGINDLYEFLDDPDTYKKTRKFNL